MLESTFTFNGLTLNDWENRDINTTPFGWYRLLSIDGLWDAEMRTEMYNLPNQHGARTGDFYYGGKVIVLSGIVEAVDMPVLRRMQNALRDAFSDLLPHDLTFSIMDSGGHGEGGSADTTDLVITCRKNQKIDMPEQQATIKHSRPFTVQLFADDPTIYVAGGSTPYTLL